MRESVRFHPLGPLTFLGATWLAVQGRRGRLPAPAKAERLVPVAAAVWLTIWVVRLLRGDLVDR